MSQNANGTFSLDHQHIVNTQKKKRKKSKMKKKVHFPVISIPVL